MILVDIGSSTIKIYSLDGNTLTPLSSKSLHLKDEFDSEKGLNSFKQENLFEIINELFLSYPDEEIKVYGTAVFRQMNDPVRERFLEDFKNSTGLALNIISHDDENSYVLSALIDKCDLDEPVLILNIGGGSTEISIVQKGTVLETCNIDVGVGTLLGKFAGINDVLSTVSLEEVVEYCKSFLPEQNSSVNVGFYTSGELSYMQLADYTLEENVFFEDKDHPSYIWLGNLQSRNLQLFGKDTIDSLKNLMPENPDWMLGARPCSALAQAIFEHFDVKDIIPSNSNLMNGIVRKDYS